MKAIDAVPCCVSLLQIGPKNASIFNNHAVQPQFIHDAGTLFGGVVSPALYSSSFF